VHDCHYSLKTSRFFLPTLCWPKTLMMMCADGEISFLQPRRQSYHPTATVAPSAHPHSCVMESFEAYCCLVNAVLAVAVGWFKVRSLPYFGSATAASPLLFLTCQPPKHSVLPSFRVAQQRSRWKPHLTSWMIWRDEQPHKVRRWQFSQRRAMISI
jgi:hypothetical protein